MGRVMGWVWGVLRLISTIELLECCVHADGWMLGSRLGGVGMVGVGVAVGVTDIDRHPIQFHTIPSRT